MDGTIARLSGGPIVASIPLAPLEAVKPKIDTPDFRYAEDVVAGAESRFDSLAPTFLDENVDHYSMVGSDEVRSAPQQA